METILWCNNKSFWKWWTENRRIIDPTIQHENRRNNQLKQAKVEKFNKAVIKVGDFVKIKLSSVQSELKKKD